MGENPNNNADFESTVYDTYPRLRPVPEMTREEFIAKIRNLVDDLESDHAEQTGVEESEPHDWGYWTGELYNAYLNS